MTRSEQAQSEQASFKQWCVLELMGHVRLAGLVSDQPMFGTNLGRIDIPNRDGGFTTQFFGGSSVYRLTPTTEEVARAVALHNEPEPVHRWELPAPKPSPAGSHYHCPQCGDDVDEPGLCPECEEERDDPEREPAF